eukprot:1955149-Pyramimonas_sp.AAC.1
MGYFTVRVLLCQYNGKGVLNTPGCALLTKYIVRNSFTSGGVAGKGEATEAAVEAGVRVGVLCPQ